MSRTLNLMEFFEQNVLGDISPDEQSFVSIYEHSHVVIDTKKDRSTPQP